MSIKTTDDYLNRDNIEMVDTASTDNDNDVLDVAKVDIKTLTKDELINIVERNQQTIQAMLDNIEIMKTSNEKETESLTKFYGDKIKELSNLVKYYERKFKILSEIFNIETGGEE